MAAPSSGLATAADPSPTGGQREVEEQRTCELPPKEQQTCELPPKRSSSKPVRSTKPETTLSVSVAADAAIVEQPSVLLTLDGKSKNGPSSIQPAKHGAASVSSHTKAAKTIGGTLNFGANSSLRFKVGDVVTDLERERGVSIAGYLEGRDGLRHQKVLSVISPELAVEARVLGKPRSAQLHVRFRIATAAQIERQEAREALLNAESEADYTTLLAQMKRGRHRGVEAALIARAANTLRLLKPVDLPPLVELRNKLIGARLTVPPPGREAERSGACSLDGCSALAMRPGEELSIDPDGAAAAFASLRSRLGERAGAIDACTWLYNVFAAAAVRAAEDGGVWRAYGAPPPVLARRAHSIVGSGADAPCPDARRQVQPVGTLAQPVASRAGPLPAAHGAAGVRCGAQGADGARGAELRTEGVRRADQRARGPSWRSNRSRPSDGRRACGPRVFGPTVGTGRRERAPRAAP